MPDQSPNHTPYEGPLPISVQAYLDGHPDRHIDVRPAQPVEGFPDHHFVAFVYSEHGWALATHRTGGPTEQATVGRVHARGEIQYVQPRISADQTHFC